MKSLGFQIIAIVLYVFVSCKENDEPNYKWITKEVKATAYNSTVTQTNSNPHITAFGDSLIPGKKYIAVSRDLERLGLAHNTLVKIEGLEGTYLVKDRMHARKRNQIDVYMGTDIKAALQFGRKHVTIQYRVEIPDSTKTEEIKNLPN
ncbi:3D domain-containing protein [Aegicerativicinus sediminis]|uniref:3D domain-containing protein n=1 Tax=Aegicerativicinus sediminis TaxID=2893202 RepID=UPI001E3AF035|nr:3D domain-containing protein [Aegicerativicinus sediminis]